MTDTGTCSSKQLYRYLINLYVQGSGAAVAVVFFLIYLGLDFTAYQWKVIFTALPFAVCAYVIPDFFLIRRHYQPLGLVLGQLDAGLQPSAGDTSAAIVRALNMPYYTFLRVVFLHGPLAMVMTVLVLLSGNYLFHAGYMQWQIVTFAAIVLFFAAPAHAIFEFFSVWRCMVPVIERLYPIIGTLEPQYQAQLKQTGLRKKLLYLAIAVTSLPLLFLALSVTSKVSLLIDQINKMPPPGRLTAFLLWIYGVVAVCMIGSFIMALLTAAEVTRSAAKLISAMKKVERGDLDVQLQITSTDEYADLFRGFNLMTEELKEEVKILGVSHTLMGELNLNALLKRVIHVSTELLDAERSTLFLYDEKTGELWSRVAEGMESGEIRIKSTTGIAGAVFTSGQSENIPDVAADKRFNATVDKNTGFRTRNMLTVPVVTKNGQRIGVTQVLNKRHGAFTAKDESRLRAFTAQIAIALENAKLFDDVLRIQNYNEAILRSTSNAMITLNHERRVVTANAASLKLLKLDRADIIVDAPAASLFAEPNAWVLDSIAKVEQSHDTDLAVNASLTLRTGDVASVNLTSVPLIDAGQKIIGSMLIFEDITDEKRIKGAMSRYMSKEVVDQLLESGETPLGGQVQRVSVLFSDIRNFTNISEAIGARETVSMLNEYFAEMVDVVFRHKGILDKYIGDAIMALFGAPFPGPQDANNAVLTANDMIVTLRALNATLRRAGKRPIDIGVGVNTGDAVVGSIGSPKRMEYTAIGDSVNLASRLEGACKIYGVKVILSEYTVRDLSLDAKLREIDLMRVKGKQQPVAIYEALDHHTPETFPNLDWVVEYFNLGLRAYRQRDWAGALKHLGAALEANPHDAPSRMYRERTLHFTDHPPEDAWDGVWVLKEK